MDKNKIIENVKKAITEVSRASIEQIKLTDKIKMYVPVIDAPNLALVIWKYFNKVDTTDLLNSLFDPIAKISDLVNYIQDAYES